MKDYAKGGQVIAYKKDAPKFKKIDVTDKYVIEAINEIGLQDVKFDKSSIDEKIKYEFEKLLDNTSDYIISEDSNAITNAIENDIQARYNQGDTEENINSYKAILNNSSQRKSRYIDKYAETQKETINEWVSYLNQSEYPVAIKFLILKSVLNFNYDYKLNELLKRNNKTIRNFTPFDAGSLSELVNINSDNLLKDYTQIQVENSAKIMQNKEMIKTSGNGTWLKFNGGSKTSEEERLKNSKELAQLVQNTYWCTKANSKSQLNGGDFYVYVTETNGEFFPRIAIRMDEDKVGEVRGNKSASQDIEEEMLPIAEKFLTENITNGSGKKWLDGIKYNQEALDLYNKISEKGLFENSIEDFIKVKSKEKENLLDYANRNGHIVRLENLIKNEIKNLPNKFYKEKEVVFNISDFDIEKTRIILDYVRFKNSGITDLGNLEIFGENVDFEYSEITDLKNVKSIGGNAYFQYSEITNLGKLQYIGGSAYFNESEITDLKNLKYIGYNANFDDSKIKSLGNLTTIGGSVDFINSEITDLGNLQSIGGDVEFDSSEITDLGNLQYIGGKADFYNSIITDLGNLQSIGENAVFSESKLTNLGNLKYINGDAYFEDSEITNLGSLTTIGGNAEFQNSKVTDLGSLTTINGNAFFQNSKITDLGNLTTIGKDANFIESKVKSLGKLTTIGGSVDFMRSVIKKLSNLQTISGSVFFKDSKLIDLGNLKSIGGGAFFMNSQITDLGNLESIGGNCAFRNSQVIDLGNLKYIGGDADFRKSIITDLGNLESIGGVANFEDSQVTNLGNLYHIGNSNYFGDKKELENEYYKRRQNNYFYHATGNANKLLEAFKNNSVIFSKRAGLEYGIFLTTDKDLASELASEYANFNDKKGNDIGVLRIKFNTKPNFKIYNNKAEQYDDEMRYDYSPNKSLKKYKEDLISKGYDGYTTGDIYLLFNEKVHLFDPIESEIKILYNFSMGGEVSNTNIIAQVWDWFGIKF